MKIELINVSKYFKKNLILKNVNMKLESGSIYGFSGRNGSGKSVLLKIISGMYKPTNGKVLFDDIDIFERKIFPPSTRVLIDNPSFISDLTGKENLEFLASIQNKIGIKEIEASLRDVSLTEEENKEFGKYSLGMKQKLGIAQVLMEDPEVMIFDEPFNGVEEETVKKLKEKFIKLKNEGKLIIISSHIKEDIDELADVVYLFDNAEVTIVKK